LQRTCKFLRNLVIGYASNCWFTRTTLVMTSVDAGSPLTSSIVRCGRKYFENVDSDNDDDDDDGEVYESADDGADVNEEEAAEAVPKMSSKKKKQKKTPRKLGKPVSIGKLNERINDYILQVINNNNNNSNDDQQQQQQEEQVKIKKSSEFQYEPINDDDYDSLHDTIITNSYTCLEPSELSPSTVNQLSTIISHIHHQHNSSSSSSAPLLPGSYLTSNLQSLELFCNCHTKQNKKSKTSNESNESKHIYYPIFIHFFMNLRTLVLHDYIVERMTYPLPNKNLDGRKLSKREQVSEYLYNKPIDYFLKQLIQQQHQQQEQQSQSQQQVDNNCKLEELKLINCYAPFLPALISCMGADTLTVLELYDWHDDILNLYEHVAKCKKLQVLKLGNLRGDRLCFKRGLAPMLKQLKYTLKHLVLNSVNGRPDRREEQLNFVKKVMKAISKDEEETNEQSKDNVTTKPMVTIETLELLDYTILDATHFYTVLEAIPRTTVKHLTLSLGDTLYSQAAMPSGTSTIVKQALKQLKKLYVIDESEEPHSSLRTFVKDVAALREEADTIGTVFLDSQNQLPKDLIQEIIDCALIDWTGVVYSDNDEHDNIDIDDDDDEGYLQNEE